MCICFVYHFCIWTNYITFDLAKIIVIWISHDTVSKFKDPNMRLKSFGIWMTHPESNLKAEVYFTRCWPTQRRERISWSDTELALSAVPYANHASGTAICYRPDWFSSARGLYRAQEPGSMEPGSTHAPPWWLVARLQAGRMCREIDWLAYCLHR